ncbi:MAG: hypothetical protein K2N47_05530 [Clostridia bacterium]|nr:hypothetical protein [Clostridia bacterium]
MHEGHRQRLVGKVKDGSTLYEHELMEILLFNACPRRDVNATAHTLIDKFGSIDGVLQASVEELSRVDGVGVNMAEYLSCLGKCIKRAGSSATFFKIVNTDDFHNFLAAREFPEEDKLELYLVDKDGRMKRICTVGGDGKGGNPSVSQVVKFLSVYGAYGVFAAYYRTNCENTVTEGDRAAVKIIAEGCKLCSARLFDYCIVSKGDILSLYASDELEKIVGHNVVRG